MQLLPPGKTCQRRRWEAGGEFEVSSIYTIFIHIQELLLVGFDLNIAKEFVLRTSLI